MNNSTQITCPNCHTPIDVQNVLSHQLEERLKKDFELKLTAEKTNLAKQFEELERSKLEFDDKKKQVNRIFQEKLEAKLREERKVLEETIRIKIIADEQERINLLVKELEDQSLKLRELSKAKAEIEILRRQKAEIKDQVEAEAQTNLNIILTEEKEKIRRAEELKNEMKMRELQKQLDDQKKLTEEMKRKQEQGSIQLQGEVQELAIEE